MALDLENLFSTNYIEVNTVNNTSYRSVEFRQEIKKRMAEFDVLRLKHFQTVTKTLPPSPLSILIL